jgi:hypothetical protein
VISSDVRRRKLNNPNEQAWHCSDWNRLREAQKSEFGEPRTTWRETLLSGNRFAQASSFQPLAPASRNLSHESIYELPFPGI